MKLITVIGARPQFIKSYAISQAIRTNQTAQKVEEIIVHTGQHYDENMSSVFFEQMGLTKPKYTLNLTKRSHGGMTGQMIIEIESILLDETPDYLLIYGDTDSTLAAAIAASKLHIPIVHVESGLRSFNRKMPEEINRIIADELSAICFCPTDEAIKNLANEGIYNSEARMVKNIGDVMLDVMLHFSKNIKPSAAVSALIKPGIYHLATVHRAENTDDEKNLNSILSALDEIAETTRVILPLHPRTRNKLKQFGISTKNIQFIDPVSYLDMVSLLHNAQVVFTDSGGLQKEAYFAKKYCITLRTETEWIELVEHGVNVITGADKLAIKNAYQTIPPSLDFSKPLYGDGSAGKQILDSMIAFYQKNNI